MKFTARATVVGADLHLQRNITARSAQAACNQMEKWVRSEGWTPHTVSADDERGDTFCTRVLNTSAEANRG